LAEDNNAPCNCNRHLELIAMAVVAIHASAAPDPGGIEVLYIKRPSLYSYRPAIITYSAWLLSVLGSDG
jgi:hypothetical protein